MSDTTHRETVEQGASEAPFGYKADGTPRKRPAPRRRVKSHNVLEQRSPEHGERPVNVRTTRRSRVPVDGYRRRLPHYDLGPDYVGRWVVDSGYGDRVRQMYENDWDFVVPRKGGGGVDIKSEDLGSNLSIVANRTVGGEKQYLMAKPRKMHEEDRKHKRRRNDAIDEALMGRKAAADKQGGRLPSAGDPNFYEPSGGRKIQVGSRRDGIHGREF